MQAHGYLRVARKTDGKAVQVEGRASAPLPRARIAAVGAVRLTRQALEDLVEPNCLDARAYQSLDDLDTCVRATWHCIAMLSASIATDDPVRHIVAEAVARLNTRCGQRASGATYAEQCLLLEVVEQMLIDHLVDASGSNMPAQAAAEVQHVNQLIVTALVLTNDRWDIAVHVLVGVALRAIAKARGGSWSTRMACDGTQGADISIEEPA